MSVPVTLNGTAYSIPSVGSSANWGTALNAYLQALAAATASFLQWGNADGPPGSTTHYLKPGFVAAISTTTEIQVPVPRAGKVSKLFLNSRVAVADGDQTFTVRKNGVDTTVIAVLEDGLTTGNSGTTSFTVVAGDLLSVKVASNGAVSTSAIDITATLSFTPS